MKMIDKLTKKQEKELIDFREECLKIGLSTEPIKRNIQEHQDMINFIYKNYLNLDNPKIIWYVDSPLMLNLVINIFFSTLGDNLWANLGATLEGNLRENLGANIRHYIRDNLDGNFWTNLGENIRDNLWDTFGDNLDANLDANLGANLRGNVDANLDANLGANLRANLGGNVDANLDANLGANIRANLGGNLDANLGAKKLLFNNVYWGNFDIYWVSFYLFTAKSLNINYTDFQVVSINNFYDLTKKIGFIWYFKDICFISDRPSHIRKKGIQLHCETGSAISFRDGYSVWCLNGINVTKEIVETPAEKLDPHLFVTEKNAEVRREIVRKIGIERVCQKLGAKVLDEQYGYELIALDLGDDRKRPYLKMVNPSIGTYLLEEVPPETKTVEQALNWRNGLWVSSTRKCVEQALNWRNGLKEYTKPIILT